MLTPLLWFGFPSLAHFFLQEPTFKLTYVVILKVEFFSLGDILTFHDTNLLLSHLLSVCINLSNYNFLWLAQYHSAWDQQTTLSSKHAYAFLA